jgi:hypothetical protein
LPSIHKQTVKSFSLAVSLVNLKLAEGYTRINLITWRCARANKPKPRRYDAIVLGEDEVEVRWWGKAICETTV